MPTDSDKGSGSLQFISTKSHALFRTVPAHQDATFAAQMRNLFDKIVQAKILRYNGRTGMLLTGNDACGEIMDGIYDGKPYIPSCNHSVASESIVISGDWLRNM